PRATPPPRPHALAVHDALPIAGVRARLSLRPTTDPPTRSTAGVRRAPDMPTPAATAARRPASGRARYSGSTATGPAPEAVRRGRSEEHTSELQSRENLGCRLRL